LDASGKGRLRPDAPWSQGEHNNHAKLTADQVRKIRARRAAGSTLVELATEYGVDFSNISCIARRKTWKHVA
jgi:hypothetical protein